MNAALRHKMIKNSITKSCKRACTMLCALLFLSKMAWANAPIKQTLVFNKPLDTHVSRLLIKRLTPAYKAIGVDISIIEFDHKSSLAAANLGELDGQIGRVIGISKEYPNLIASNTPLMYLNLVLLTNKGQCENCRIQQLSTISHNPSYPFAQKFIAQEKFKGEVISNNNLASQLHMLRDRTIDGILVLEYLLTHHIDDATLAHFDKRIVSQKPIHHYLHKQHKAILAQLDLQLMQSAEATLEHKTPK
ncbi:hypothetical protein CWC15_07275 [Pseudoalteromonas spongiae]|nr:hypothetical protein CWC15_07275 [Pseudoalteromonas spongiae]